MPRKKNADMTDHVFEFRKDGKVYEVRHRIYVDKADGKTKVSEKYIATKEEIKERAAGGYKPYLDGKLYRG